MTSPHSGTVSMDNNPNPSSNSDSNPSEVANAADDECIAPVAIFDAKMRGYVIFTCLFTCLAFVTLLLYRPMDPRELITQAALQRSVESEELFSPYRTIQYKLTHNNKREENATNRHYLITTTSLPPSSSSARRCPTYSPETAAATFTPNCSILPPLPKLSLPTIPFRWERNEFVAPLPKDPLKLRDGSVRPSPKSPAEMGDQFKKWEEEFSQILDRQSGNVMNAFHEYLHLAVDPLEVRAEPIHTVDQAVTVLDGRKDPMVIFGLKHTFNLLGPGWGLIFFHTSDNEEWLIDQLKIRPGEAGQYIEMRRVQPVTYEQANSLPMSSIFHEKIPVETILLIQPDAFMLRSPWLGTKDDRDTWNDLLAKNAYLGAPWGWCSEEWCRLAGNGGVSMRKRSVLTDLISEIRCDEWSCARFDIFREATTKGQWWDVEDTAVAKYFLTHHQKYRERISPQTRMGEFSLEHMEVPSANPFFVHKIWNYQSRQRWVPLLAHAKQYYPELW